MDWAFRLATEQKLTPMVTAADFIALCVVMVRYSNRAARNVKLINF